MIIIKMFDTLLKPKFFTKCKSCVKMTKMRLDSIKKKKNAVQKFLKNDIVDLLKNGLDYNAYGRAEGLLIERNILSCYNLIDEFCTTISNQISVLNKQRECPDDCKEAVASLIYAAARFSDLPELRDLRSLFTERYGRSLEAFANKEFVEKSRAMPVSKEMKLQLLQEIAQESSIEWNSKSLEQQLYTPPQDEPKISPTSENDAAYVADKTKVIERKTNSQGRKDISDDDSLFDSSSCEDNTTTSTRNGSTDQDVYRGVSEEADSQKPFSLRFVPPPYLKTKPEKKEAILEEPPKVIEHVDNDESSNKHPESVPEEKPKPRSVRQRNLRRPLPARENINDVGNSSSSLFGSKESMIPEEKSPRDDEDTEEKMLNGLLKHYSRKKSTYELNKAKGGLKSPRHQEKDNDVPQRHRNTVAEDVVALPARATSLPTDTTSPTETEKRHARTVSDMVGHVHPKLPDYDQLAARIAALRGK